MRSEENHVHNATWGFILVLKKNTEKNWHSEWFTSAQKTTEISHVWKAYVRGKENHGNMHHPLIREKHGNIALFGENYLAAILTLKCYNF
jgi:hypothetical protein